MVSENLSLQLGMFKKAEPPNETYKDLKDNYWQKETSWGTKDVKSTISGSGGQISYLFPRSLCVSSSEMSQVVCDFTLSLISPAVSLFKQFFWRVTNN